MRELLTAIPWGHHANALAKVADPAARLYSIRAAAHFGWSRDVLQEDVEVEFALKTKTNPIGVAEYQLQPRLPAQLKGRLPSATQLAAVVREVFPSRK